MQRKFCMENEEGALKNTYTYFRQWVREVYSDEGPTPDEMQQAIEIVDGAITNW